jgi:hypothetical protein
VAQATNTYGSVAANSLRGPGLMSWDFSIFKNFEPKPGYRLQARIEMFNVLNRANYANPASALGAANFGTIRSMSGLPRNVPACSCSRPSHPSRATHSACAVPRRVTSPIVRAHTALHHRVSLATSGAALPGAAPEVALCPCRAHMRARQ